MMLLELEINQKKFKNEYHKLSVNLIYTGNWINNINYQILRDYDITVQQYNLLRILRGQNPEAATIKILQERMLDKMSNASRLVEKLRLKGLAKRIQCRKDRREVNVYITEKGLYLLKELDDKIDSISENFKHLTIEEINTLNILLDKLRG